MPLKDPQSIIVLTREHIGDLVCTTPAIRSLKKLYPNARITLEVGERAACVLANNPNIYDIIIRKDHQGALGKIRAMLELRRRRFDVGVILDLATSMPLALWLAGVGYRVGLVRKRRFAKLLSASIPFDPHQHEMVDNFRNVVALLGADISDKTTEVYPAASDAASVDRILKDEGITAGETLIALNPGASAPSNRWLPEGFARLIDKLSAHPSIRILLLGGHADLPAAHAIERLSSGHFVKLTDRLSIMELAALLGRCRVVVTGDTGPMHIAVAMGATVVCLFGPAVPDESGPGYAAGHRIIRKVEGCANCTKYLCREDQRCMRLISADEVYEAVMSLVEVDLPMRA